MPKPPPKAEQTWLLIYVRRVGYIWRDFVSFGGWLPLYHEKVEGNTPRVHRRLGVFDLIWSLMVLAAVGGWFGLYLLLRLESAESAVQAGEIVSPSALARAWSNAGADTPQGELWHKLPQATQRTILAELRADVPSPTLLDQVLTGAINLLISQNMTINLPADLVLPPRVEQQLARGDKVIGRTRMNRALFESLFPGQIRMNNDRSKAVTELLAAPCWACGLRLLMACIVYRLVDMLISVLNVCPFGVGAVKAGVRSTEINRRLVLLNLMSFMELIFWNATLLFYMEEQGVATFKEPFSGNGTEAEALVHALQTSFSTVSTIGYGTYAPNSLWAVLLTLMEVFTGMLLISVAVAQTISLTTQAEEAKANDDSNKVKDLIDLPVSLRNYTPVCCTVVLIGMIYFSLISLES